MKPQARKACRLYANGYNVQEIAKMINYGPRQVYRWIRSDKGKQEVERLLDELDAYAINAIALKEMQAMGIKIR